MQYLDKSLYSTHNNFQRYTPGTTKLELVYVFASLGMLFGLTFPSLVGPDVSVVTHATTHCDDD